MNYIITNPGDIYETSWDKKDQLCVKTDRFIKKGEIIIIEHVLCGSRYDVEQLIINDDYLYRKLYPRNFNTSVTKKINYNSFLFEEEKNIICICDIISSINHSCKENAFVTMQPVNIGSMMFGFVTLWAMKDINPGDEITISYGKDWLNNKRGVVCECENNHIESPINCKISNIDIKYIEEYLLSEIGYIICKKHINVIDPDDSEEIKKLLKKRRIYTFIPHKNKQCYIEIK